MDEIQHARQPLQEFNARIRELLREFPDHAVLKQLLSIGERILRFPINSSLMKVLTGLELLHKKGDEWESYAHKGVSIKGKKITTMKIHIPIIKLYINYFLEVTASTLCFTDDFQPNWILLCL